MAKKARRQPMKPAFLRQWREAAGLSRAQVISRLAELFPKQAPSDQATLAKWESGEAWITMQDLEMLAVVYGVPADALFRAPGDKETPGLLRQAYDIVMSKDRAAVRVWVSGGQVLRDPPDETPSPEKT